MIHKVTKVLFNGNLSLCDCWSRGKTEQNLSKPLILTSSVYQPHVWQVVWFLEPKNPFVNKTFPIRAKDPFVLLVVIFLSGKLDWISHIIYILFLAVVEYCWAIKIHLTRAQPWPGRHWLWGQQQHKQPCCSTLFCPLSVWEFWPV